MEGDPCWEGCTVLIGVVGWQHRLLCERRFSIFHYPVMDDEAPDYRNVVHNPMDVATLLQRVDSGQYLTKKAFLGDVDLIPANAQVGGSLVRGIPMSSVKSRGWSSRVGGRAGPACSTWG